ncbi:MAG: hypothetical protein J6J42_06300 [Lachnospiraceae bacterium]|nr:hypothetical protein [Lachnospiraceae bacterium]
MRPVIDFKAQGMRFYFDVQMDVTKLCDDSGVGKSFLCESLKTALKTYEDTGKYPVKDKNTLENVPTIVIDGLNVTSMYAEEQLARKGTLIVVDEADMLFNKYSHLGEIVLENENSIFVLVARSVIKELPIGYDGYAKIRNENRKIVVEYFRDSKKVKG